MYFQYKSIENQRVVWSGLNQLTQIVQVCLHSRKIGSESFLLKSSIFSEIEKWCHNTMISQKSNNSEKLVNVFSKFKLSFLSICLF